MVDVDDGVKPGLLSPVHKFSDPVQTAVYLVFGSLSEMPQPSHRDPYGLDAFCL